MIPTIPGVPSWGAVLIAVTFTAIGFAFDAGSGGKELTLAFAVAYALGCVAAVVAVRQTGIFTAVIQPPLILFVCVPGAYFLFHDGAMDGVKDLLINCGYPLIERFPLMFFTTAIVLLVGLVRWYTGMSRRRSAPAEAAESESPLSVVTSKISALLTRDAAADEVPSRTRLPHGAAGSTRSTAARGRKSPRRPPREHAASGPPSAHSRRARGTPARRRPRSSNPSPSALVGRAPPVGAQSPTCHLPSRGAVPVRRRRENPANRRRRESHASNHRRASGGRRISGPIGTAGSTASNRSNRTERPRPTGRVAPTARATAATTRSRGCAIAAPTTATRIRSIGPAPAPRSPSIGPMPGSTTSNGV